MKVFSLLVITLAVVIPCPTATMTFGGDERATPNQQPPGWIPSELSLRMEGAEVLNYGDEVVLHYQLLANDAQGYSSDAYLGVALPNGRILYADGRGQLTAERTAIVKNMRVEDGEGAISFGPVPGGAPTGLYTFYSTLTYAGKNPFKSSDRISNLANTQFILYAPPPTNTPAIPTVPTPTPSETPFYCNAPMEIGDAADISIAVTRAPGPDDFYYVLGGAGDIYGMELGSIHDNRNSYNDEGSFTPQPLGIEVGPDLGTVDVHEGDYITVTYDGGRTSKVYFPQMLGMAVHTFYVSTDGSTYYDWNLCNLAQQAPTSSISADFTWDPDPGVVDVAVEFTDLSTTSDPPIVSWSWTFDGGDPGDDDGKVPQPVTWGEAGYHSITLDIEDAAGKTANNSYDILIIEE